MKLVDTILYHILWMVRTVKISRTARGDFTLSVPTDSSHSIVFSAVQQHALSVDGTNDFSFLPSSPTNDNWFDSRN